MSCGVSVCAVLCYVLCVGCVFLFVVCVVFVVCGVPFFVSSSFFLFFYFFVVVACRYLIVGWLLGVVLLVQQT